MNQITPMGLMIRKLRLENQTTLGHMAEALGVSSAYLSAVEHGRKAVSDSFIKKVHLYFSNANIDLARWNALAEDSQPQMKLDLGTDRELKLAFGKAVDLMDERKKQALLDWIRDDHKESGSP